MGDRNGEKALAFPLALLKLALTAKPRSHEAAADMSTEMPGKGLWEEIKPLGITMQRII